MKVYPLLNTSWRADGTRDITIVVEVFSNPEKAFNYAIMLAEEEISRPMRIPDLEQNTPVDYEADFLRGFVHTLDANGNIVNEFTLWYETVK